jgi:hypothetical protein
MFCRNRHVNFFITNHEVGRLCVETRIVKKLDGNAVFLCWRQFSERWWPNIFDILGFICAYKLLSQDVITNQLSAVLIFATHSRKLLLSWQNLVGFLQSLLANTRAVSLLQPDVTLPPQSIFSHTPISSYYLTRSHVVTNRKYLTLTNSSKHTEHSRTQLGYLTLTNSSKHTDCLVTC